MTAQLKPAFALDSEADFQRALAAVRRDYQAEKRGIHPSLVNETRANIALGEQAGRGPSAAQEQTISNLESADNWTLQPMPTDLSFEDRIAQDRLRKDEINLRERNREATADRLLGDSNLSLEPIDHER